MEKKLCISVRLCELTCRSIWCPILYLSALRVYLHCYIIICWPSHMIWDWEVQNHGHPREPSGTWWETRACDLTRSATHTSSCTRWPAHFTLQGLFYPSRLNFFLLLLSFGYIHHLMSFFIEVVTFCRTIFSLYFLCLQYSTAQHTIKY